MTWCIRPLSSVSWNLAQPSSKSSSWFHWSWLSQKHKTYSFRHKLHFTRTMITIWCKGLQIEKDNNSAGIETGITELDFLPFLPFSHGLIFFLFLPFLSQTRHCFLDIKHFKEMLQGKMIYDIIGKRQQEQMMIAKKGPERTCTCSRLARAIAQGELVWKKVMWSLLVPVSGLERWIVRNRISLLGRW